MLCKWVNSFSVLISARASGKTAVIWAVLMMAFYPEELRSTTKPGVYSNRNSLQLSFLSVVVLSTFHCHLLCWELEKNCRNLCILMISDSLPYLSQLYYWLFIFSLHWKEKGEREKKRSYKTMAELPLQPHTESVNGLWCGFRGRSWELSRAPSFRWCPFSWWLFCSLCMWFVMW